MFLYGTFTIKSHKNVPISFDTSICPSIPSTENITIQEVQNRLSLTFRYLQAFPEICQRNQILFKTDNNRCFARSLPHVFLPYIKQNLVTHLSQQNCCTQKLLSNFTHVLWTREFYSQGLVFKII